KPDRILGIGVEVLVGQERMNEYSDQRSTKHACEYRQADGNGIHGCVSYLPKSNISLFWNEPETVRFIDGLTLYTPRGSRAQCFCARRQQDPVPSIVTAR